MMSNRDSMMSNRDSMMISRYLMNFDDDYDRFNEF